MHVKASGTETKHRMICRKKMEKKKQYKQNENPKLALEVNSMEENTVVRSSKQRYLEGPARWLGG